MRRIAEVVHRKHLTLATERTCCAWFRRYCDFLKGLPLRMPGEHKLERFLTALPQNDVAASTQNQAFNGIIPMGQWAETPRGAFWECQTFNFIGAWKAALARTHSKTCRRIGRAR